MTGFDFAARLAPWLATGSPWSTLMTYGATGRHVILRRTGSDGGQLVEPIAWIPSESLPTGLDSGSTVTFAGVSYLVDGVEYDGHSLNRLRLRPKLI